MGTTMFCYAMMRQRSILGVKPAAPSDIAGLCKNICIQSLTFKPALADPASWWWVVEPPDCAPQLSPPPPSTSLLGQLRLV